MKLLRIPVLALGLLAACGDSTGPDGDRSGSLRFDYSGSGYDGSFSASGALELDGAGVPEFGSFAFASRDEEAGDDALFITAFDPGQPPRGDAAVLAIESARGTGDYSLDFGCDTDFVDDCAFGAFVPDVDIRNAEAGLEPEGEVFVFTSGTLRLTRLTDEVVEGSFSGTGLFVDVRTGQESGPVQVTRGSFRVPVLRQDETGVLTSRGSLAPALSLRRAPPSR